MNKHAVFKKYCKYKLGYPYRTCGYSLGRCLRKNCPFWFELSKIDKTRDSKGKFKLEHGMSFTPTYQAWADMIRRCSNTKFEYYSDYGGRGIRVCDKWKRFINFLNDMGVKPTGMTLERMDNNSNYELDNCKWATQAEQNRNKRNVVLLTYNKKTMTIREWEREYGINRGTLNYRIKQGWNIHKALTQPVKEVKGK